MAYERQQLAAIVKATKGSKISLAIAWLDIANAYGSIHHAMIVFAMAHYHAPPEFRSLLQSWYRGLSATVSTRDWVTFPYPFADWGLSRRSPECCDLPDSDQQHSDTLRTREDLGFSLPSSSISVNQPLH